MYKVIGFFACAAAGIAAAVAWFHKKSGKEQDVIVENLRYRGAY